MKWIKTKKQLPKNDDFVLAYVYNPANKLDNFEVAYYDADEKYWFNNNDMPIDDYGFFVLYWQKLPNKPK